MYRVVLLRHGESTWNRENRFTGWVDVDLSEKGLVEAQRAGRLLKDGGYTFDVAYSSLLKRAIRTLWIVQDELDLLWIPVHRSWRLNERHYGALQGLNKAETAAKHGEAQVKIWRRSYDIPPPPLTPTTRSSRAATRAMPSCLGRPAAHRVPQGHGGPLPALLARDDRAGDPRRAAGDRRGARQQPARAGQVPRRHQRPGHRRAQHPDRHPAGLRARRRPEADPQLLPRRRRRGERRPRRWQAGERAAEPAATGEAAHGRAQPSGQP